MFLVFQPVFFGGANGSYSSWYFFLPPHCCAGTRVLEIVPQFIHFSFLFLFFFLFHSRWAGRGSLHPEVLKSTTAHTRTTDCTRSSLESLTALFMSPEFPLKFWNMWFTVRTASCSCRLTLTAASSRAQVRDGLGISLFGIDYTFLPNGGDHMPGDLGRLLIL